VREVAPARELALGDDLEAGRLEERAPLVGEPEAAGPRARAPRAVVRRAHGSVPSPQGHVLVDDRQPAFTQHTSDFIEKRALILRVVQHVAEQHGVERAFGRGEVRAVEGFVLDGRVGAPPHVNPGDARAEHAREVVRDEAAAAAHVEHARAARQHARNLQSHVVRAADEPPPALAPPAPLKPKSASSYARPSRFGKEVASDISRSRVLTY
jgi:hypothetical protein